MWTETEESPTWLQRPRGKLDSRAVDRTAAAFSSDSWDQVLKIWSTIPTDGEEEMEESTNQLRKKQETEQLGPTRTPIVTCRPQGSNFLGAVVRGWRNLQCILEPTRWSVGWSLAVLSQPGQEIVFHYISYTPLCKHLASGSHMGMSDCGIPRLQTTLRCGCP